MPLYRAHRDWFYDRCKIGSVCGATAEYIWGGRCVGAAVCEPQAALEPTQVYGISAQLTFSNSLLREEHLADRKCNVLCRMLHRKVDVGGPRAVWEEIRLTFREGAW